MCSIVVGMYSIYNNKINFFNSLNYEYTSCQRWGKHFGHEHTLNAALIKQTLHPVNIFLKLIITSTAARHYCEVICRPQKA